MLSEEEAELLKFLTDTAIEEIDDITDAVTADRSLDMYGCLDMNATVIESRATLQNIQRKLMLQ